MSPNQTFDERVVVVTGALGLLGRTLSRTFSDRGARVFVTDRDGAACAAYACELPNARGHALDVTDEASVEAFTAFVEREAGPVDVLVNNAALNDKVEGNEATHPPPFEAYPRSSFERMLSVNVLGVFMTCQHLGTRMAARGRGSIVNVASTYALVGPDPSLYREDDGRVSFHKSPAYPATKGAVLALTRYLAAHWGASGVRVNALSPGGIGDGQDAAFVARYAARTPLGRMALPLEVARAAAFLASDEASYMTGANLVVDGGFTCW